MKALDFPLFKRLARGKDGGHGRVRCCKPVEVIHMRLIAVVLVEPCWSVCPELNRLPPTTQSVFVCLLPSKPRVARGGKDTGPARDLQTMRRNVNAGFIFIATGACGAGGVRGEGRGVAGRGLYPTSESSPLPLEGGPFVNCWTSRGPWQERGPMDSFRYARRALNSRWHHGQHTDSGITVETLLFSYRKWQTTHKTERELVGMPQK